MRSKSATPARLVAALADLLAPPLCVACRRHANGVLCGACATNLASLRAPEAPPPPGIDAAWSAAPYEGVARELIVSLKFRALLRASGAMSERIAAAAPPRLLRGALVPVPPSPSRLRGRGFDPALEIAGRLAVAAGLELVPCLVRGDGPRQVGRPRRERLTSPPRVEVAGAVP